MLNKHLFYDGLKLEPARFIGADRFGETDGRIQFLGDCTHHLAGQTVDLPDFEA